MGKRPLFLLRLFFWIARGLLSLRYKLEVKGLEAISEKKLFKNGKILFLPNHPAEIDPVILMAILGQNFFPRPLVVEHFYRLKGFQWLLDLIGVMPVPTMDERANKWRGKQLAKQFQEVVNRILARDNFLIYPSGKLKLTGLEIVGGSSFVHQLLQACPEVQVVLVRTTGLWGSSFSRALTGQTPNFGKTLLSNFIVLLKNGLFFTPRRKVKIEFLIAPSELPVSSSRLQFNKYLEEWYNQYPQPGPEPLSLVSYRFWKEDLPEISKEKPIEEFSEEKIANVPTAVIKDVFAEIAKIAKVSTETIQREMHLSNDLGLDSLDITEVYIFLDRKYEAEGLPPGLIQTVEDVLQAAVGAKRATTDSTIRESKKFSWPEEPSRPAPYPPEGSTLHEAFLRSCDQMGSYVACSDATSGTLNYKKLKTAALILSKKFKEWPGDTLGILLPASVGANLVILAALLAKKTPVMLNWTTGIKALDHAAQVTQLQTVITSRLFLDRLENGDLGVIEDRLQFLEDLRLNISWKEKLSGLFTSFKKADALLADLGLNTIKPSDPAVILFTSGTETLPKAVPLSHQNLLCDQRGALSCVTFTKEEILYSILPPFHSFGFSITGVFPLLAGLRVYYAPNPTDSQGLAHDIAHVKPTLFICAPSFIRSLFAIANPDQLQSLKLVVSGAEKTPQELFDYLKQNIPHARMIEGYGITECGPVVTLNRPEEPTKGVGKPLPGIELCIIDPITGKMIGEGSEGEICIAGPNVFSGYMGSSLNPFVEIEGKKWYRSGDRGFVDAEGNLFLSGRLKRFIKVGGEMVSLGGLEDDLFSIAKQKKWYTHLPEGPPLALSVKEYNTEKPELILFTTFDITKEEINASLKESGWGRIIKIAEVRRLSQIPLTGTGKTHYRLLDEKV